MYPCPEGGKRPIDVFARDGEGKEYKNSEEGRRYMCEVMERIEARGKAEGEAEGKRKTMLTTAKRMLKSGMLAMKDIAKFSGLSLAQVKKLQASMA